MTQGGVNNFLTNFCFYVSLKAYAIASSGIPNFLAADAPIQRYDFAKQFLLRKTDIKINSSIVRQRNNLKLSSYFLLDMSYLLAKFQFFSCRVETTWPTSKSIFLKIFIRNFTP